jgi:DNA helicase HerA-like ATPase
LRRQLGDEWLLRFLTLSGDDLKAMAEQLRENINTLDALQRRLGQLRRLDFMQDRTSRNDEAVRRVLEYIKGGRNVVLEFGRHGDDLTAYLLVANLITRRIHADYRRRTEEAQATGSPPPTPLVITIEEAHRFLGPQVAGQTIFGAIARELRKYGVTLLVVDQRPSGIDEEVLSQIGTRITCQLDNERDVDAVLTGTWGARELKAVLSRLEARQQALMFGHALPMPVVVRTRDYGTDFYAAMAGEEQGLTLEGRRRREGKELFGKE